MGMELSVIKAWLGRYTRMRIVMISVAYRYSYGPSGNNGLPTAVFIIYTFEEIRGL